MAGFPDLHKQRGLSFSGLVLTLILIGAGAVIGMEIVPAVVEYQSIKKAVDDARHKGNSILSIEAAFDKQANAGYITAIHGEDLDIVRENGEFVVSFAYAKKLHLFGPASLLLEFSGRSSDADK